MKDGLLFGQIGSCPECETQGLYFNGYEYTCKGYVSSFTKCSFKGNSEKIKRYKFVVPKEVEKHKFFKSFEFAEDHPTEVFVPPEKKKEASEESEESEEEKKEGEKGAQGEAGAPEISKKKNSVPTEEGAPMETQESGDMPEDEIPMVPTFNVLLHWKFLTFKKGLELYGITLDFAGGKKTLGHTQKELKAIIENHGGKVSTVKDETLVTVLITSAEDIKKGGKKIVLAQKEKVAMLPIGWLTDLTEREGDGLKLRTFEHYKEHLLNPEKTRASLKQVVASKYFEKGAGEKRRAEENVEGASKKKKKKNRRREHKPRVGSDILKVDPESDYASSGQILLTYDEEFGWTPYNVMLNKVDLESGVNKFYRMQVIKKGKQHFFWINWGRIGVNEIGDSRIYDKKNEKVSNLIFFQICFFLRRLTGKSLQLRLSLKSLKR